MFIALALLANLSLILGLWYFGQRKPGYRQLRHTISELGESGSVIQHQVAWLFFMPLALVLALLAYLLANSKPALAGLATCLAIGYAGACLFPCDPGSPMQGSWRQQLHNLAGGIEYVGGAACLLQLAKTQGLIFQILALIIFALSLALSLLPKSAWRGLMQRLAEGVLFGGLLASI